MTANNASSVLTQAVRGPGQNFGPGSSDTWSLLGVSPFPAIGSRGIYQFRCVVDLFTDTDPEIVIVESVNPGNNTFVVIRGAEGSTMKAHQQGAAVTLTTTRDYYKGLVPAGTVVMHAGASSPDGWLLCDGNAYSRTDYPDLFAACGTTWGAGDGSTTFNVPDLRGRFPLGAGTGPGLPANSPGGIGGTHTITLDVTQMPNHAHTIGDHGHVHGIADQVHSHNITDPGADSYHQFQFIIGFQPGQSQYVNDSPSGGSNVSQGQEGVTYRPNTENSYTGITSTGLGFSQLGWANPNDNTTSYVGGTGGGGVASVDVTNPFRAINFIIKA